MVVATAHLEGLIDRQGSVCVFCSLNTEVAGLFPDDL